MKPNQSGMYPCRFHRVGWLDRRARRLATILPAISERFGFVPFVELDALSVAEILAGAAASDSFLEMQLSFRTKTGIDEPRRGGGPEGGSDGRRGRRAGSTSGSDDLRAECAAAMFCNRLSRLRQSSRLHIWRSSCP